MMGQGVDMDERSCREKHSDLFHTIKKIIELETKSLETRINGIDRATVSNSEVP